MCGSHSALGLEEAERDLWPQVRDRLRRPRHLMGLMRGVLAEDVEVAAVVAITPQGVVRPVALLATPFLADEVELVDGGENENGNRNENGNGLRPGRIGDYDVEVLLGQAGDRGGPRPLAILVNPWMFEHLALYARKLWSRR